MTRADRRQPVAGEDRRDEAASLEVVSWSAEFAEQEVGDPRTEGHGTSSTRTASHRTGALESASTEPEDQPLPLDVPEQPTPPPAPKPSRRKRASVPSWDEIVFGGPKEK